MSEKADVLEFKLESLPNSDGADWGLIHIGEGQRMPEKFKYYWEPDLVEGDERLSTWAHYSEEEPSTPGFTTYNDGVDLVLRDDITDCKVFYKGADITPIITEIRGGFNGYELGQCVNLRLFVRSIDAKVTPEVEEEILVDCAPALYEYIKEGPERKPVIFIDNIEG